MCYGFRITKIKGYSLIRKDSVSKVKQGTVIGSMKRGPRMFGVRYGPCDRPALDEEELLTSSTPPYDVASKYVTNMPVQIYF